MEKRHGEIRPTAKLALVQIQGVLFKAMIDKSMNSELEKVQVQE